MPLLASSPTRGSTISRTHQSVPRRTALDRRSRAGARQAVCNGSSLSEAQGATLHGILRHPPQILRLLPVVSTSCGPPAAISCLYRDTAVPYSVVGPFLWPDRWSGTRLQDLRDPTRSVDTFRRNLKTSFLALLAYFSALGA